LSARVEVSCRSVEDGWACTATVVDVDGQTRHEVTVSGAERERFAPNVTPEQLVEESFRFLLEREPKEAILRQFAISAIERYFPDYGAAISERMSS
jgi:hypothetical protein